MWFRRFTATLAFSLGLLALTGCGKQASDVMGQAYIAPASVNLRRQLTQKNSPVAALKHGERVSIIDVRRRFVKVRTSRGLEGWMDSYDLLSSEDMARINKERQQALALPSEGWATVFEPLNIHIDPSRQSPAFAQIPENGSVMVLGHRLTPRTNGPPRAPALLLQPRQGPAHKPRKEKQSQSRFSLPAPPPPPKPPANWQDLFGERVESEQPVQKPAAVQKEPAKPVVLEDWTLVRTKNNQCGWVLSRNLMMSIPDEVAQYAEGKRITSYFDLGAVNDEEKGTKHNWLWTTASSLEPYDFDGWRVFLWNRRRHRYETSYREHDVEGYFPVHVDPAEAGSPARAFALITRDDDNRLRRRTYLFDGVRVHLTATEDWPPRRAAQSKPAAPGGNNVQKASREPGWFQREWNALRHMIKRKP
jgi:SH3-like domain-containing protein